MPDGRIKYVLVKGTASADAGGKTRIRGTVQDITERKRAEEEKAKLQAQLNQAQKMESIGRLAGGVAHDFNNLLTVINGYSNVLIHQLTSPLSKYAEQINKAGESAASLTRQLLAFSRMDVTHLEPVFLNDLVAESRDMLERLVGEHIEMNTSLHASPDEVLADPNQINQCLMNLAVNARDAMPAGGQLTIETGNAGVAPDDIPVGSNGAPGPHVRLTVRDTGVGMDQETSQHIFEPFFTTKEKGRGTGLGLSTVYGIVSQWQGFIKVGSTPGKGSEFSIYLPLNMTNDSLRKPPVTETGALSAPSENGAGGGRSGHCQGIHCRVAPHARLCGAGGPEWSGGAAGGRAGWGRHPFDDDRYDDAGHGG
jgi:signal transduction histidine kinase